MGSEYSWAVDALVIVLLIVSAYLAMVRGFFRELFALASWVVAFVAAFWLAPIAQPYLTGLPYLGEQLQRNCEVSVLIAFVLVVGIALILTGLVIWMMSTPARNTAVSVVDQALGLIYGALRGLVLVGVLLIAYQEIFSTENDRLEVVESAVVYPYVAQTADVIRSVTPTDMPGWLADRIQAMSAECEGVSESAPANGG